MPGMEGVHDLARLYHGLAIPSFASFSAKFMAFSRALSTTKPTTPWTELFRFPVVKQSAAPPVEPNNPNIPAVYLVRDGRDCAVSMAHYRRDLIEAQSELDENLRAVIEAEKGSHFGGWSHHVRAWLKRAAIVIRFEELIGDPIGQVERLRTVMDLPHPKANQLPSFQDLQSHSFAYGSGRDHGFSEAEQEKTRRGKFRRGKAGGWSDVMPFRHELLFLRRHGPMLEELGYPTAKSVPRLPPIPSPPVNSIYRPHPRHLLLDGINLADRRSDGIRRYTQSLMGASMKSSKSAPRVAILVRTLDRNIFRLKDIADLLDPDKTSPVHGVQSRSDRRGVALKRQVLKRKVNEAERLTSKLVASQTGAYQHQA